MMKVKMSLDILKISTFESTLKQWEIGDHSHLSSLIYNTEGLPIAESLNSEKEIFVYSTRKIELTPQSAQEVITPIKNWLPLPLEMVYALGRLRNIEGRNVFRENFLNYLQRQSWNIKVDFIDIHQIKFEGTAWQLWWLRDYLVTNEEDSLHNFMD
jgi:hypothetical protein